MKLRTKIIAGFLIVAIIGWLVGIAGLISMQRISSLTEEQDFIREAYDSAAKVTNAHFEWRQALTQSVYSAQPFNGSTDPTTCALGKWLASDSSSIDDGEIQRLLKEIEAPHHYVHSAAKEINALIAGEDPGEAIVLFEAEVLPKTNETISLIAQIEDQCSFLLLEKSNDIAQIQLIATWLIVGFLIAAILVSVVLALLTIRSVMRPIRHITDCAEALTTGLLDIEVNYAADDEIGRLGQSFMNLSRAMKQQADVLQALSQADYTSSIDVRSEKDTVNQAINHVIRSTNEVLNTINIAAEQVSAAADQVSSGAQALASGSTEQAATIEQLNSSVIEIAGQAEDNSARVQEVTRQLENAGSHLDNGNLHMEQLGGAMKEIHSASQEVSSIAGVIENIAFQTNILALNAAIEAARAGAAGKGFAVVADEVRNLAAKSAEAAKETSRLLGISEVTVNNGLSMAQETAEILEKVSAETLAVIEGVTQIDHASAQQVLALEQVREGLNHVSSVVQNNAATSEENSAASEEMSAQAGLLRNEIRKFKLKDHVPSAYSLPASQALPQDVFHESHFAFDKY